MCVCTRVFMVCTRYSLDQVVGVLLVTAGVIWATLDNASNQTSVSFNILFYDWSSLTCEIRGRKETPRNSLQVFYY